MHLSLLDDVSVRAQITKKNYIIKDNAGIVVVALAVTLTIRVVCLGRDDR